MAFNRVFSGHCRIEAAAGDGQALFLEGMRIHLDLQLEPESTTPLPGSPRGRKLEATATERIAPRRPSVGAWAMPTYQQWAVLAALASLLLALASWWIGGDAALPVVEPTEPTSSVASEPEPAPSSAAPAVTVAAPAEPPVVLAPVVAPAPVAVAPAPAPAAPPAATAPAGTPRPPSAAPGLRTQAPKPSGGAQQAALVTERAGATAARGLNADLLYLFDDTK